MVVGRGMGEGGCCRGETGTHWAGRAVVVDMVDRFRCVASNGPRCMYMRSCEQ